MIRFTFLLLFLVGSSSSLWASELEQQIAKLQHSYEELYRNYDEGTFHTHSKSDRSSLETSQRNWIKNILNKCNSNACLKKVVSERQYQLNSLWANFKNISVSYKDFEHTERVDILLGNQNHFLKYDDFSDCEVMVTSVTGSIQNQSFASFCVTQDKNVMICEDEMIGHFMIEEIDRSSASVLDLAEFLINNCVGG